MIDDFLVVFLSSRIAVPWATASHHVLPAVVCDSLQNCYSARLCIVYYFIMKSEEMHLCLKAGISKHLILYASMEGSMCLPNFF